MEKIIIGTLVAVSALYVINRLRNSVKPGKTGGCGGGCGNCKNTSQADDTKIVTIPLRKK